MEKVLFVCLGNICRSTMAEAVFRHQAEELGLAEQLVISSRGTSNWNEGQPPHAGTQAKLAEHGIGWEGIYAEQIKPADFLAFDQIVAMDKQNVRDLKAMAPQGTADKISLMMSVLPEHAYQEIPDPYYTGDFDLTYQLVAAASGIKLAALKEN